MELEQLHKYMHLNNLANGTVEVLFAGQPALTINNAAIDSSDNFRWVINPVFARLTYGANVLSDVPMCMDSYDSVEMAAAMGMEKLESMGAFKTLVDLPEDTFAVTMGDKYNADEHIMNRELHSFALSATNGNITEAAAYLKKFTTKKIKPRGDAKAMCEKLSKGESLTGQEMIFMTEHIWAGNPTMFNESGLSILCKIQEVKKEKVEPTTVSETVEKAEGSHEPQKTLFEQFKAKKVKLSEERENKRLVSTNVNGAHKTKIYRLPDTDEYKVEFHKDGAHQKDADYFTNDKKDATGTSDSWLKKGIQESRERSEFAAHNYFMAAARDTKAVPTGTEPKKKVRIIGPTGGTVSKHDDAQDAQRTFKNKKYSMSTHKIVGEAEDGTDVDLSAYIIESDEKYEQWAKDVQDKHGDKGIVLKGRVEKGAHTTSAEIPGKDRCYAVFDHDTNTGHIFEEEEEIIGEEYQPIDERELTDAESAKREEIVMALKKNKGFVSKYGKDAIWAVATAQAKTAGA